MRLQVFFIKGNYAWSDRVTVRKKWYLIYLHIQNLNQQSLIILNKNNFISINPCT